MGMNRPTVLVIASLFVALHGCGFVEDIQDLRPPTFHLEGNCTVVLDWTGGDNPIWSGDGDLPPIDLAEFELAWPSRGTLADVDGFREMVRAEVESVLSGSGLHVIVEEGEQRPNATVVHFSQVVDPESDLSIGRGHFDTCNISDQDYSIVYAARLLEGNRHSEGRWVRIFANVAAHEIAHNLGFDHVELEDVPDSEFTELMLASQTTFQRMSEQRIIVEQDTCVVFDSDASKAGEGFDRDGRPTRPTEGSR